MSDLICAFNLFISRLIDGSLTSWDDFNSETWDLSSLISFITDGFLQVKSTLPFFTDWPFSTFNWSISSPSDNVKSLLSFGSTMPLIKTFSLSGIA